MLGESVLTEPEGSAIHEITGKITNQSFRGDLVSCLGFLMLVRVLRGSGVPKKRR